MTTEQYVSHLAKQHLSRIQASNYLGSRGIPVACQTLAKWASTGGGPRFVKFGRKPLYTLQSLDEWLATRLSSEMRSTSEMEAA